MNRLIGSILLFLALSPAAYSSVPSGTTTPPDRRQPVDGNSVAFTEDHFVGYKVFVATAAGAVVVRDEAGNAAVAGVLHMVCVSSGSATSDYAVAYDSAGALGNILGITAANQTTNVGAQITPLLNRSTTLPLCQTVDAQFNNALILLQSAAPTNGTTHAYWRPLGGGRN